MEHPDRSLSGRLLVAAAAAVLAVVAAVAPAPSGASTDVTISDANFAAAIASALGEPDGTTTFTTTDLAGIATLRADDKSISSIAGISHMTGLRTVRLADNDLTSADFSSNTSLRLIHIADNDLTSITVTGLNDLKYLYAEDNNLTTVALPADNDEYLRVRLTGNAGLTSVTNQRHQGCESADTIVTASPAHPNGCDESIRMRSPSRYMTQFFEVRPNDDFVRLYRGENIGGTEAHNNQTPDDDSDDYSPALVTVGPVRQGGA